MTAPTITIENGAGAGGIGTRILAADGTDLAQKMGVESIDVSFRPDDMIRAVISVALVKTKIAPNKFDYVTRNPASGQFEKVRQIAFDGGPVVTFNDDGTFCVDAVARHVPLSTGRTFKFRGE